MLIPFHPPTYRETLMATTIGARIYARGEVSFAKFLFFASWFLPNWLSCFAKLDGYQLVSQTLGVALRSKFLLL
jgi:hypothetical protein